MGNTPYCPVNNPDSCSDDADCQDECLVCFYPVTVNNGLECSNYCPPVSDCYLIEKQIGTNPVKYDCLCYNQCSNSNAGGDTCDYFYVGDASAKQIT